MKRLIILFSVLMVLKTTIYSQGWTDISANLPDSTGIASLNDMYWISDNEGWICSSAKGEIYHTVDGGQTFTTQTTQYYTNAIWMLNASEGYAVGYIGKVYRTTDGGANWDVIGSIGGTLHSICFPPASDTGYCSGDNGRIYRITSSGVSSMYTGLSSNLTSISFPENSEGWSCGGSIITHYSIGSWNTDQVYPSEIFNSLFLINSTVGWAVGDAGALVHTIDGLNWDYQSNPDVSNRTLNDVFFLSINEGWAAGNGGIILHTTNGGNTWAVEADGMTTNMLRSVRFTSSDNGYVLGNNGTLLKYTSHSTSVTNVIKDEIIIASPNPTTGIVRFNFPGNQPINRIAVYNIQGQKIMQADCLKGNTIDLSGLTKGVYMLNIETTGKIYKQKIIKE